MRISSTLDGRIIIEHNNSYFDASDFAQAISVNWPLPKSDPFMQIWPKLSALSNQEIENLPKADFDKNELRNPIRSPNKILGAMANYLQADGTVGEKSIRQYGFFPKANSSMTSPAEGIVKHPAMETLHEPELSFIIGDTLKNADEKSAAQAITAVCGSLDMTGRGDWLWSHRKSVDSYGVFDVWLTPMSRFGHARDLDDLDITLYVNGEVRQSGTTAKLIWKPVDLVMEASKYFTLYPGDIIMAGTPAGLGPVEPGDTVKMTLERIANFEVFVR